jgi:RNA polymerase sigma factor (sigma-70 family)
MADSSALTVPLGTPMRLTPRGDARLARAAAAGDERAFADIYARYHQELYRYCRAILGDAHEAQDALQNTMVSALRSLPGESRTIELRPWLYRVAHNESVSIVRRRHVVTEDDERRLPPQPGADVAFESRERLRTLVSDLAALPERQRSALVMLELSGLSHEQISTVLGISPGVARQTVYEARLALLELEEGRAMECERVRRAISDGDGRVLRGRKLRAHLRGCERCSDFRAGIETRSAELELIAPPLTALAASGVLASVLGGGSATAGAGAFGGLFAGGFGSGIFGAKTLGVIAASAAIGVGAGAVGGVDVPGLGSGSDSPPASESRRDQAPPAGPDTGSEAGAPVSNAGSSAAGNGPERAEGRGQGRHSNGKQNGHGNEASGQGDAQAASGSAAGGASAAAPAGSGQPETPPGGGVAGDRSSGRNTVPSTGPPEHANQGAPAYPNAGGVSEERKNPKE